jgi:heterodisulfide reductase subunit A-like polyferredoxin
MVRYQERFMASSGYVSRVDERLCTSCGLCVAACPFGALSMNGTVEVNWEKCLGCGVCTGQCPPGALTLVRDERKGIPLDVRLLA